MQIAQLFASQQQLSISKEQIIKVTGPNPLTVTRAQVIIHNLAFIIT